jgi:hypothetical protein
MAQDRSRESEVRSQESEVRREPNYNGLYRVVMLSLAHKRDEQNP